MLGAPVNARSGVASTEGDNFDAVIGAGVGTTADGQIAAIVTEATCTFSCSTPVGETTYNATPTALSPNGFSNRRGENTLSGPSSSIKG